MVSIWRDVAYVHHMVPDPPDHYSVCATITRDKCVSSKIVRNITTRAASNGGDFSVILTFFSHGMHFEFQSP